MLHSAVSVAGVPDKDKLVMVAFRGEHFGHVFIGYDPIMHAVTHDIRIEQVSVPHFHPDSNRLARTRRDQVFMKLPGAVGGRGIRKATVD